MRIAILLLFLLTSCFLFGQDRPEFDVAYIPDSLQTDAASIVRMETVFLKVSQHGRALVSTNKVVTVFNSSGKEFLSFADYEDDFRKLQDVKIFVYNSGGKLIDQYKKSQLHQSGFNDGFSLINDQKIYYLNIPSGSYPVTVAFQTEVQRNGYLDFDDITVSRMGQAIENLTYTIHTTADNPVRYKNFENHFQPEIKNQGGNLQYTWIIKNRKALPANSSDRSKLPKIAITPTQFEMDGNKGYFTSWQSYGLWYYNLCYFSYDLKESDKENILAISAKAIDEKNKIILLYRYLQQNFRYVSVQLGIGGFKPQPASFVQKNKYGDCKALSNYMQSILRVAGINSYQALIYAGKNHQEINTDFPNHAFNHVILCVPNNKDTIWLECTSSTNPFGKLGAFTENRNALLITPDGGKLVSTPKSKAEDNRIRSKNLITIASDFSAYANLRFLHSGEYEQLFDHYLRNLGTEELKEYLVNEFGFKPFEALHMSTFSLDGTHGTQMKIQYNKIDDFRAGTKYFISPHLFSLWKKALPLSKNSISDYLFDYPFQLEDTTVFSMPEDFTAVDLPVLSPIRCSLASFSGTVSYDEKANTITIITRIDLNQQKIPAKLYVETQVFFEKLIAMGNLRLVVKKR